MSDLGYPHVDYPVSLTESGRHLCTDWLRVRRSKKTDGSDVEVLSISVVARNNSVLKQLVLQAKKEYELDAEHRVNIYFADSHGSWRWTDSRHKVRLPCFVSWTRAHSSAQRPMSSIVLNPGVKEMLLNDARDFLKSEKWYADRGIPFRRGYLYVDLPMTRYLFDLHLEQTIWCPRKRQNLADTRIGWRTLPRHLRCLAFGLVDQRQHPHHSHGPRPRPLHRPA